MFDDLTNRLSCAIRNISGYGRLTESNIEKTLREIRIALIEADVALSIVRDFISRVKERSIGQQINKSLTPGQEFVKIVFNELISVMGNENKGLNLVVQPPAVIMMVGLQGMGKTTSIAKLGKFLYERYKKKVLVVSTDVYRPAANRQLEILTKQAGVDFFSTDFVQKPIDIVNLAVKEARLKLYHVLLVDTAGCLHVDKVMMNEIKCIHTIINPVETFFVVDAMIGQDAANIANKFIEFISITGIILTKVDSDARGGAALSMRYITGKPIKFLGVGESIEALELFQTDRIASRILGMDDVLSFIEDIESKIDHVQTTKLVNRLRKNNDFDLTDFLYQLGQMRSMGGIGSLMNKFPGVRKLSHAVRLDLHDKTLVRMEAIINSMTFKERENPEIIKGSRKRRIAAGSGMQVQDVNRLLRQFNDMQYIMKKIKKGGALNMVNNIKRIMKAYFFDAYK